MGWEDLGLGALALLAALVAGAVNAVAGGGTIVSFPVLIWLGVPPVAANATSAVALWPGGIGAAWGFRSALRETDRRWLALAIPSLLGGVGGAVLLLETPPALFSRLAPFLVLGATALLALRSRLRARAAVQAPGEAQGAGGPSAARLALAVGVQLLISVYGGYFGAGLGILQLAVLSLIGLDDLHQLNGLKNVLAVAVKGAAVAWFALQGPVVWSYALLMGVGALAGGWLGAWVQQRIGRERTHRVILVIGGVMGLIMLARLS